MKDLFIFEFKKIIRNKVNIIIIIGSLILATIFFSLPTFQFVSFDKEGNQINGVKGIKLQKELEEDLKTTLTDEKIKEDISNYQRLFNDEDNVVINGDYEMLNNEVFNKYVSYQMSYLRFIGTNYVEPNMYDYSLEKLKVLDIENEPNFYEQRNEKIDSILNSDIKELSYSDKEKEFWQNKNKEIDEPFTYEYHEGFKVMFSAIELMALPIIAICMCIAPVFSSEYQSGADNIILSSKYGKSKLITSKILASFVFAFLIYSINIVLGFSIVFITFGVDGWNLPIQVMGSIIPYKLNLLEAAILSTITLYIIMFAMTSLTLFLSSKLKTSFSVLVIMIVIILIPLFLKSDAQNTLWDHIFNLLPYIACQSVFSLDTVGYLSYEIFGFVIDIANMKLLLYFVISIICIPFTYKSFRNHQIS